jgi:hypothetical protein
MKKTLLLFISFLFFSNVYSQLQVYPHLEYLKDKEVIFIYKDSDKEHLDEFKKQLSKAWTIGDLILVSYQEYKETQYPKEQYVFSLYCTGFINESTGNALLPRIFLKLHQPFNPESYNEGHALSGSVELDLNLDIYISSKVNPIYNKFKDKGSIDYSLIQDFLYSDEFKAEDWSVGLLKHWLKETCTILETKTELYNRAEIISTPNLLDLKTETLYIPEEYLNSYKGMRYTPITLDIKDLMKRYDYKYMFIPMSEISQMIIDNKDFNYLTYQYAQKAVVFGSSISAQKFLGIRNSKSGKRIASNWSFVTSSRLNKSDFKVLNKLISEL